MDHTVYILVFLSMNIPGLLPKNNTTSTESVHFRLVGGANHCHGSLEMKRQDGNWKPVNGLLCPGAEMFRGTLYGEAEAPVLQTFQCEGHESALLDCGSSGSQNCSSGTAVDLICTDPDDVRLVGGVSRCNGEVEMKYQGEWRYMGYYNSFDPWTLKAADVICRRLDCGSAVSRRGFYSSSPTWSISPYCLLSTSTLKDCVKTDSGFGGYILSLTCSDSVRLVHGSSLCSGRLEVRSNQSWTSMCEEGLDLNDTQVVCRELGCGAPGLLQGGLYGEGEAPVWTSELQCEGNESAVLDCRRSSSTGKTCSPATAAGLTCTGTKGAWLSYDSVFL
ncbi:scavenger receptor cysteine-rich type 1 protein M130-like [Sphaeramia orbicularis]|uniref:scavenger receptor cysteine-rich type 1 protein M130-like n=1 Tax=Sphaeramia orbicularis TaxID=375764 RepID=UPI00117DD630|nr:scavenger receptor cysteine-rich type 1 protein M130-like [Sphaeramia orbicularis]